MGFDAYPPDLLHEITSCWYTVDGRNPAPSDKSMKPCKWWDILHINWCRVSGAGFLPSTLSLTSTQPVTGLETKAHFLTTRARPSSANLSSVCVFVSTSFQRLCGCECLKGIPLLYILVWMIHKENKKRDNKSVISMVISLQTSPSSRCVRFSTPRRPGLENTRSWKKCRAPFWWNPQHGFCKGAAKQWGLRLWTWF